MLLILDDELSILRELRPLDRDIFTYLAERVDFKTGVVGKSRRVSYGGMALDLSERDVARRVRATLVKLSSKQVENAIARLVVAGLFERLSLSGQQRDLVLKRVCWCTLLLSNNSVQNPVGAQLGRELGGLISLFSLNNNDLQQENNASWEHGSGSVGTTSLRQRQQGDDRFLMTLDWGYSEDEMAMILHRAGFKMDKIRPEWITEFVSFWWADEKKRCTQREWTAKLGIRLVNFMRNPAAFEGYMGNQSKVERVSGNGFDADKPAWCRPPRDDEKLVMWMRQNGYADPAPGLNYKDARAYLQRAIDSKYAQWRKGLS